MQRTRRFLAPALVAATLAVGGCHREVELPPLPEQKISLLGDRFFDVRPVERGKDGVKRCAFDLKLPPPPARAR